MPKRCSYVLPLVVVVGSILSPGIFAQENAPRSEKAAEQFIQADSTAGSAELPSNNRARWPGLQPNSQVLLPNGWSLDPQGTQIQMGDFPANIQCSPDGKFAAVLHCGYGAHEIRIVDLAKQEVCSTTQVPQAFYGLDFSEDGKVIAVSGGEDEQVYLFPFKDGFVASPNSLGIVDKTATFVVSDVQWLPGSKELLVCGLLGDAVKAISAEDGAARWTLSFGKEAFPYAACIDANQNLAYVSLWGKSQVAVVDLKSGKELKKLTTLSHPTEMHLLDGGKMLLVACSNDNSVLLINTESGQQREQIRTSLFATADNGSTPASLAVSKDEKVLMAANADNNNVALFDISERGQSKSLGFIPVGWYPTCVRFDEEHDGILVANGKGLTSRSNVHGSNPNMSPPATVREYIGGLFQGTLSCIPKPAPVEMAEMTRKAFACSPLTEDKQVKNVSEPAGDNPIPSRVGDSSPIKHCIYIIKENRTYDQVFGDMPVGNGDETLCIFPRKVTPNHHALAEQFVVLDNFYVESEVSADGHEWTMAAYATDFVEKTWPLSYRGGRGKLSYPAEGAFDIATPTSGYLWDQCKEKGVSYFSFGEFVSNGPTPEDPATTTVEALKGHFDPMFRSYDLDYTDVNRAKRFIERFQQFEKEGDMPQLMIVRLPNDHTYGTRVGKPTPTAMVADNDVGLGMIVEAVSQSDKWKETAIFVIQDDAQNGADHVDAHRTVALAISPYTRNSGVDSTLYSTASMLRTMELILGLEPMTQFDAAATPMTKSFHASNDFSPYQALPAGVSLDAKNDALAWGADLSEKLDLSKEDAADDLLFGEIVWRSVKGADSPMPPPVRSAFVFASLDDDDDDHDGDEDDDQDADDQ